jgi:hypothetical protein
MQTIEDVPTVALPGPQPWFLLTAVSHHSVKLIYRGGVEADETSSEAR